MALESITPVGATPAAQTTNQQQAPLARDNERAGGIPTDSPNDSVVIALSEDVRADNELRRGGTPGELDRGSQRRQLLEAAVQSHIDLRLTFDTQRGASFIEFVAGNQVILTLPSERFYDFVQEQLAQSAS